MQRNNTDVSFMEKTWKLRRDSETAFTGLRAACEEDLEYWVGRTRETLAWKDQLARLGNSALSYNCLEFVVASYGRGKTLALLRIKRDALASPGKCWAFYLTYVGEEGLKPRDFLTKLLLAADLDGLAKQHNKNELSAALSRIPDRYQDAHNAFAAILMTSTAKPVSQPDTAQDIFQTRLKRRHDLANEWLSGQNLTRKDAVEVGVVGKVNRVDSAIKCLLALRILLKALGYSSMVVCVDEYEYLFGIVGRKAAAPHLALLRHLFDSGSPDEATGTAMANLGLFLAITESGWTALNDMGQREKGLGGPVSALLERGHATVLPSLTLDETRELIAIRLRKDHTDPASDPILPFTNDFVAFVWKFTEGSPRKVYLACDVVVTVGLQQRVPTLTADFARRVLDAGETGPALQ